MKVVCDGCAAKYSIADERVRGKTYKIRCRRCKRLLIVNGETPMVEEPQPLVPTPTTTPQKTHDSSLIDIRALAAAAARASEHKENNVDELASLVLPTPVLAPVLVPSPRENRPGLIAVIAAIAVLFFLATAGLTVLLITTEDNASAETDRTSLEVLRPLPTTTGRIDTPEQTAAFNRSELQPLPTSVNESPEQNESSLEAEEPQDRQPAETNDTRRGPRRNRRQNTQVQSTPRERLLATSTNSPTQTPAARPQSDPSGMDKLINEAIVGKTLAQHVQPRRLQAEPTPREQQLPLTLNRAQVQAGLRRVAPSVQHCGGGERGMIMVNIVINGATGRVRSARVQGQYGGTSIGSCAARAARDATFPLFRNSSLTVLYPFAL